MSDMYQKIADNFDKKYNCCQVVLAYACSKLGLDEETAIKFAATFGGGMGHGETCGCVTGGLMALGLAYGDGLNEDEKKLLMEAKAQFETKFKDKNGSLKCRDLLGLDFDKPEEKEKIMASGILKQRCPQLACDAGFILDRLLLQSPCAINAGCSGGCGCGAYGGGC